MATGVKTAGQLTRCQYAQIEGFAIDFTTNIGLIDAPEVGLALLGKGTNCFSIRRPSQETLQGGDFPRARSRDLIPYCIEQQPLGGNQRTDRICRKCATVSHGRLHKIIRFADLVDEAHLIDRWGQDFRTEYSRIAELRRRLGDPPVIACTATAGVETQQRILRSLDMPDARVLVSGVDRPNIALARLGERSDQHRAQIVAALLAKVSGRAMIFIPTKKVSREAQAAMASVGLHLPLFHGELDKLERDHLQNRTVSSNIHKPIKNGGGEIRTLGTPIRRTTVFETAAFNRSATSPERYPQG